MRLGQTPIAVTGGCGFIGSALCNRIRNEGAFRARAIDDESRGNGNRLLMGVDRLPLDVRQPLGSPQWRNAFPDAGPPDAVFHLAAINGTKNFYERPREVLDVQIRGTLNVIDACVKHGVKTLVLFSSSEVYATPPIIPTPEDVARSIPDITNPRFSYSGGKIASELLAWHSPIERVVLVLPHNVVGPNMGFDHVIPEMTMKMARATAPFYTIQNASAARSFIHITDFVDAMMVAWKSVESREGKVREIFHIGTEDMISISSLAGKVARIVGREFKYKSEPGAPGGTRVRCPDTAKIRGLGWSPKMTTDETVESTVKSYLANRDGWPA